MKLVTEYYLPDMVTDDSLASYVVCSDMKSAADEIANHIEKMIKWCVENHRYYGGMEINDHELVTEFPVAVHVIELVLPII